MYWYPMYIDSKQHLFDLDITQSFKRFPEVYFQIHLMQDDSIRVFWRTELSRDAICQVASKAMKLRNELMKLSELEKTPEYYHEMEKVDPLQSAVMDETEKQVLLKLFHDGLPQNGRGGRDGHGFDLIFYHDPPQRAHLWCYTDPELTLAAETINLIVRKAGLDPEFYGVRIIDYDQ
jgi:hypothetical protein